MRILKMLASIVLLFHLNVLAFGASKMESETVEAELARDRLFEKFRNVGLDLSVSVFTMPEYLLSIPGDSIYFNDEKELNVADMILYDSENRWFVKMHDMHIFYRGSELYWNIEAIIIVIIDKGETSFYEISSYRKDANVTVQKSRFHYTGNGEPPISDAELRQALFIVMTQFSEYLLEKE